MKRKYTLLCALYCLTQLGKSQNLNVQSLLNDVRLDSLKHYVRQLSGETSIKLNGQNDTIKTRYAEHPDNEKAFQFMKREFVRYGYQIDSLAFGAKGKNLFAIKPGYKYPNRRFMLGAHYDNLPPLPDAPGADDNASGSATVLEGVRVFRNYSFPYTIVFALWDEEEAGLLGSYAYVPTIGSKNDTLIGYVNVDMLGWDGNNDSTADINVKNVANSPVLGGRAQSCNSIYNIGLNLHMVNPGSENTDHAPFWYGNHTAIGIDEEYDKDFNPHWHTLADSLGQFNQRFYLKCAKLAYATIADCAADSINTVGISRLELDKRISIFPNPFHESFAISSGLVSLNRAILLDSYGNELYHFSFKASRKLDVPDLAPGVYFLQISADDIVIVRKLIKY